MIELNNIKNNIVLLRKERKVSQRQLADFLHVSPQTVSGWENGSYYPDIPQIINLANYFEIQIDGLFENKKTKLTADYDVTFESLGKTIGEWRKSKELTQKDLADKLYVSPQAVSRWERGQGFPDITIFPQICELFNVSLHELFTGDLGIKQAEKSGVSPRKANRKITVTIVCAVLALLIVMGVLFGVFFGIKEEQPTEKPSVGNVFVVNTYDEFMSHSDSFMDGSAYFVLGADISAANHQTIDGFNAGIDGKGFTVTDLTVPFIKTMYGGARISNIRFDVGITATVGLNDRLGGVVITNYGYLENVWLSGNIDLPGQYYIGGVVGSNYGNLRNIENTATIACADYAGGIVGFNNGIVAFSANNGSVASILGSTESADDPMLVKHSGSIAGYVGSGVQLNGCLTTVADIDAVNPLYGQTNSTVDFSLSVLVTPEILDQALFEWLNYDPENGELYDDDNIPVNRDEAIWYDNTGKWVRIDDKPHLALFNTL